MKSRLKLNRAWRWTLGGLVGLAAAGAQAQAVGGANTLLNGSFVMNLGAFVLGTDLSGNLNGQSVNNPEVDFDQTFGKANDATRGRVDALWRINPNHHLRFLYFDNSTDRSRVIDKDFQWGDYTFKAGGNVDSKYKFNVAEIAYEYAFMRSPTYEVAGSFGIHYTDISLKLSGNATVTGSGGGETSGTFTTQSDSVKAPLPVIGIRAGWVVAPQWYIDAQAQLFSINSGAYGGNWSDMRIGATWMFSPSFGLGLGWNRFSTKVDVDKDNFQGRLKVGYSGIQAYVSGAF